MSCTPTEFNDAYAGAYQSVAVVMTVLVVMMNCSALRQGLLKGAAGQCAPEDAGLNQGKAQAGFSSIEDAGTTALSAADKEVAEKAARWGRVVGNNSETIPMAMAVVLLSLFTSASTPMDKRCQHLGITTTCVIIFGVLRSSAAEPRIRTPPLCRSPERGHSIADRAALSFSQGVPHVRIRVRAEQQGAAVAHVGLCPRKYVDLGLIRQCYRRCVPNALSNEARQHPPRRQLRLRTVRTERRRP